VRIRVLTTDVNMNGIENSVAIETFRKELARRGLSDLAEFRYYTGRMHAKAFLVDDQFLVVGSQNFHYSAWGDDRGLVEYNLATNSPAGASDFRRAFEYYWQRGKPVFSRQVRSE
jgi:cardiolipin synthase